MRNFGIKHLMYCLNLMVCIIRLFLTLTQHIFLNKNVGIYFLWGREARFSGIFFSNPVIGSVWYNYYYMTTSVPRGLNILCIMFKIKGIFLFLFYNIAVLPVYGRVGILLISWKYLHDHIMSLRWAAWAYTSC